MMLSKRLNDRLKVFLILLLSTFIICSTSSHAARRKSQPKRKFPHGCREVGYSYENQLLVLKPAAEEHPQTLYLIHNLSKYNIHLSLVKLPHQTYSPRFENEIKANRWAAFATDEPYMQFRCSVYARDGEIKQTDCDDKFELCQYTRAKFSDGTMGNYWIISNVSRYQAKHGSIDYGILLRW